MFKKLLYINELKVKELIYLIKYIINKLLYINELKIKKLIY
jgi:hypothetical protein